MTTESNKLHIKDFIVGAFALLMAVIGWFINQRLSDIDNSIKEFYQFQREQIKSIEYINGELRYLHAKDSDLDKKDAEIEIRLNRRIK